LVIERQFSSSILSLSHGPSAFASAAIPRPDTETCVQSFGFPRFAISSWAARTSSLLVALSVSTLFSASAQPARFDAQLRDLLTRQLPFAHAELNRAEHGSSIVVALPASSPKELGIAGLTWIEGDPAAYLTEQRASSELRGSSSIPEAGMFAAPARLQDLRGLHLEEADLLALRECHEASCLVKLFREDLSAFAALSGAEKQDPALLAHRYRLLLLRIMTAYQTRGNHALGIYADSPHPLSAAAEFDALLANSRFLRLTAPALERHLREFPVGPNPANEDLFSWSKVSFGLKPTVRLNHITIHRNTHHPAIPWVIASKQVYAAHYFQAALELRFLITPPGTSKHHGYYLLTISRSRNDGLEGFWRAVLRTMVRTKSCEAMARYLAFARQRFAISDTPTEAHWHRMPMRTQLSARP
jgi:hypothetical protein